MRNRINQILTKPYMVVAVMLFAPLLKFFDRNFSFFFGLGIVWLILWATRYKWSLFGLGKKLNLKTVLYSLVLTVFMIFFDNFVELIVRQFFGEANLSSLDDIKHNTTNFVIILLIVWTLVSFGEELLYRGYYMKWLAELLGDSNRAWIASAAITSLLFGLSHYYQGPTGMITIAIGTFVMSLVFAKYRDNLWILILTHGLVDTWGLTFLYLDRTSPVRQWMEQLLLG
ncbi:CPBP family intramembrane glutamic endopeptidase [Flagellimonas lutimaris]|nr:type II CAAX endopeptidase family protein [Allomuricauda lutimaris]